MTSINLKKQFTEIITDITNGTQPTLSLADLAFEVNALNEGKDKELYTAILKLANKKIESDEYVSELSKGNFEVEAPQNNEWVTQFKNLQSNLNSLAFQIQRISEGDLYQRVNNLGDMSYSINKLIFKLQEKKQIEKALKNSERKFKTILETSPDGIAITDLEGKVQYVTSKIVSMWGYESENEIVGKNVLNLVDQSFHEKSTLFVSEVIKGNLNGAVEYLMVRKDGSQFFSEVNTNVLNDENNTPVGVLYIERDVTQRKEIEELISDQIKELSNLNATKDKFFRIIAHDLKNPFNSLMGLSKALVDKINNGVFDEIQPLAQSVNQSATQTYKLLENLLDWSRLKTGKLSPNPQVIIPSEVIDEVLRHCDCMAKDKNIKLQSQIDNDDAIWADKNMLLTILRNLISNAIKFTNSGGHVKVLTHKIPNNIQFEIIDNGIGIHHNHINKLFKIDNSLSTIGTNNENGTGLGLILCKEFVDKNNGKIWAESYLGEGSEFKFTVPLSDR